MNTQIPWHTTGMDTMTGRIDELRSALAELRDKYAEAEAARQQAEDAQETAETAQRRAEERAQREADRADGAEALARALLDTHHITPAMADLGIDPLVPTRADVEAIADVLADDWAHGTEVDSLDTDTAVRDWATDRGLL